MSDPSPRRDLKFERLDEVLPEVDRLAAGYQTLGRWTLGQICWHLARTLHGSIDGFNMQHHRWKRRLGGRMFLAVALTRGIPRDYTVDPALTPPEDVSWEQGRGELDAALHRYLHHHGPWQAHPLFGRLDRATWDRVHRVHFAHHLRLLIPAPR